MVQVVSDLRLRIREALKEDPTAGSILAQIKRGEMTRFKEKDGLLYYEERLYVPRNS